MAPSVVSAVFAATLFAGGLPVALAQLKIDSKNDIIDTARILAEDLINVHTSSQPGDVPGLLAFPPAGDYFWWESGLLMGSYIDYWHLTGDSKYNTRILETLLHQLGPNEDFMPTNQTASEANDDQCIWALAAMSAAETGFLNPPANQTQWLQIAQNVFNEQSERIDTATCNGGLRWLIIPFNNGYNYKNSVSNGCFFQLGARLARYTGDAKYAQVAEAAWDWLYNVNYIDHDTWAVYDGAGVESNCTTINKATFSHTAAILTQGAAFLYNHTNGADVWRTRVENLSKTLLTTFFPNNIAYEVACEGNRGRCTTDMLAFKGLVHRSLSVVTQLAPFTANTILPVLLQSATAAVRQCTGSDPGRRCGFYWSEGEFVNPIGDSTTGAGEQMNVLAAVSSLLIAEVSPPATSSNNPSKTTPDGTPSGTGGQPPGSTTTKPGSAGRVGTDYKVLLFVTIGLTAFCFIG